MKVHGKNILYFPYDDLSEFVKKPKLAGIPFLAPWADLLDEQAFWANGKRYGFNMSLGNVRGVMPGHGFLINSPLWEVTELAANSRSRTSDQPASILEVSGSDGAMAVRPGIRDDLQSGRWRPGSENKITNLSADPMPVIIGFHPFFQIPGIPRDEWTAHLSARLHVVADETKVPTGEMRPLDIPNPLPLRGQNLDDGFTGLERDADGRAHFSIEAGGMKVETLFGPKYQVATI